MRHEILFLATLVLVLGAWAADDGVKARYAGIPASQLFGPVPKNFDPYVPPTNLNKRASGRLNGKTAEKEAEKLQAAIRFSMLDKKQPDDVIYVGFSEGTGKDAHDYYLPVGATGGVWVVKSADLAQHTMTLSREVNGEWQDFPYTLTSGDGKTNGAAAPSGAPNAAPPPPEGAARPGRSGLLRMNRLDGGKLPKVNSMRALRERRQAEAEAAAAKAAEEKAQREEREAKMKAELESMREEMRADREAREAEKAAAAAKAVEAVSAKPPEEHAEGEKPEGEDKPEGEANE